MFHNVKFTLEYYHIDDVILTEVSETESNQAVIITAEFPFAKIKSGNWTYYSCYKNISGFISYILTYEKKYYV